MLRVGVELWRLTPTWSGVVFLGRPVPKRYCGSLPSSELSGQVLAHYKELFLEYSRKCIRSSQKLVDANRRVNRQAGQGEVRRCKLSPGLG